MRTYHLTRSEPDADSCRSSATWYYVDGKRVSMEHYYSLQCYADRWDSHTTTRSKRGRWLHSHIVYYA